MAGRRRRITLAAALGVALAAGGPLAARSAAPLPSAAAAATTLALRGLGNIQISKTPPFAAPASGCSEMDVPGTDGVRAIVRDGRVTVVLVTTAKIPTRSGVAVGQASARVTAVYGSRISKEGDVLVYKPDPGADAELRMTFEIGGDRIVAIRTGEAHDVLQGCSGAAPAPTTAAPAPAPSSAAPAPVANGGGKVVVIDPGHNGANGRHTREINALVDAGGFKKACNTTGTAGLSGGTESAFNWAVAQQLGAILSAHGWQVVYTRNDDAGWGPCVDQRGQLAGKAGAVALLSIHADGAPASGHGFHVIWARPIPKYTATTSSASHDLAVAVRDAMVAGGFTPSTYLGSKGLDSRGDLGTLNRAPVPSMMIECGNMRNAADDAMLASEDGRKRIAAAIAGGFERWYAAR